jgi:hypothetical protein
MQYAMHTLRTTLTASISLGSRKQKGVIKVSQEVCMKTKIVKMGNENEIAEFFVILSK